MSSIFYINHVICKNGRESTAVCKSYKILFCELFVKPKLANKLNYCPLDIIGNKYDSFKGFRK